jgi:6-phosphogluconolactonase
MANQINLVLNSYTNKELWINAVTKSIDFNIRTLYAMHNEVNMLLSGGSTPGPIYKKLDSEISTFKKLNIGLVDERFVPIDDDQSNEKLLKQCFDSRPSEEYNIIGMVTDDKNEANNLIDVNAAYAPFIKRTDIVVLGMGGDGHTASIFPNDPGSDIAKKIGAAGICSTMAPAAPTNRISASMDLICNARYIYLLISGAEKLEVLNNYQFQYPIHTVLERRPDVEIYYLEK